MILFHLLQIGFHRIFWLLVSVVFTVRLVAEQASFSVASLVANPSAMLIRSGFKDDDGVPATVSTSFNEEYLLKYFPKAYVIRERFFSSMTADEVDRALAAIVELLSEKPEVYFVQDPKTINVALYWEHILDQCSLISEFLKKARVESATGKVFLPQNLDSDPQGCYFGISAQGSAFKQPASQSLLMVWRSKNKMAVADFYALCFDYLIKLFNEGFLIKDSKQIDRYYAELEYVFSRMRGTIYESSYQETIKHCKELMTLFKTKYRTEDEAMSATGWSNGAL